MVFGGSRDIGQDAHPNLVMRRQPGSKRRALLISLAGFLAEILSLPAYAQKLPTNPNVTSGTATFSQPNASTLNINQSTPQAIINWNTFSVGRGDTVNFNQPGATSSTLNRVTSNTPSWIAGAINAPGTVLLVNPNGIAITKSGVINTGSFIASTLGISDQDYLNGKYNFNGNGASAKVVNNGHINVSDGGFAALLGGHVANNGVIVARLGKVGLGSGEQATIDLSGDGFLSVAVPTSELGNLRDETGKPLVSNKGKIVANGGSVYLSAATAANILRDAINVPGTIRADSVGGHNGAIYLGGGPGGTVTVSGHLSANGGTQNRKPRATRYGRVTPKKTPRLVASYTGTITTLSVTGGVEAQGSPPLFTTGVNTGQVISLTDASAPAPPVAVASFVAPNSSGDQTAPAITPAYIPAASPAPTPVVSAYVNPSHGEGYVNPSARSSSPKTSTKSSRASAVGDGGIIQITGASITTTGTITANGATGGKISIIASNNIAASGQIQAKGKNGRGGEVDMTANHVALTGISIDASGATGGGNVNIGGGPHASVALADAQSVSIDSASIIRADAINTGNGGHIIIWSDQTTDAGGFYSATGGQTGGNGGYIEISSQTNLTMRGFADLSAPNGTIGTLLFDPGSINIVHGSNSYTNTDTFTDGYLSAQLATANITIDTNDATGANGTAGDITLMNGAAISWNAGTTLTFNAARNIVFSSGSSINTNGGSVVLNAGDNASGSGTVSFLGSGTQITVTGGGSVNAYYNPAAFGTPDFQTSSVSVTGGGALTAYMLINSNGQLTAVNNNLNGNYALATDLNFGLLGLSNISPTCSRCFEPLGTFNGKFDGRGHTITFTAYSHNADDQGLFQAIGSSGVINNLNVNMWGYAGIVIGGLAGENDGLIENSHASTTIFLIGDPNNGLATASFPTSVVGGLVGINRGTILNSSAAANTQAGFNDGGLVGVNFGTIANSSASGAISVGTTFDNQTDMGGLVGQNVGTITGSFSSVNVNDFGNVVSSDGGFVGENNGTISSSYSTGNVTGGFFAGGFVGQNDVNAHITASFSTGTATAILGQDSAGFVGNNQGIIAQSYSTGTAGSNRDGTTAFGFAATNSGTLSNDYWDTTTSHLSTGVGITEGSGASGTAAAVQSSNPNASNYAYNASAYSSDFMGSAWYMVDGFTRPLPIGLRTNTITTSNALLAAIQLELVGSALNGNYALGTNIDLSVTGASTLWGPRGFGPIGAFDSGHGAAFTGVFNGNGYTISNLNINAGDTNFIGLFGQNAGTIENLGLNGGTINGLQVVGAIAASNSGTITTSYATTTVEGGNNVGGLVGSNAGGTISDSYYIGSVTSGLNGSSGPAGGIAGLNYGRITRTYAAATVRGNGGPAGGLVGHNENASASGFGVASVTQSYWNTDLTTGGVGLADSGTTFSAGGMTTAQMQDLDNFQSNFAGFNFQTTWAPPNQAGQGGNATAYYPELYADSHIIWVDPNPATTSYGTPAALTDQTYGLRNYDTPAVENITLGTNGGNSPNASSTPYVITASGSATSTDGSSYRIVTTGGTLTVNPLDLTGTAQITNINKTYDGTAAASGGTVTLTSANGVINGETVTISVGSGTYANANVIGIESVMVNGVSISSSNYVIGNLQLTGQGSISPEQLTVSANSGQSKTYGSNDPTLGYTITTGQLYNGDHLSGALTRALYGMLAGEQVGSYSILQGTLGVPSANYAISFTPGTTFAINPATLTVAANAQTKTYGINDPTLTYMASGFVNRVVDGVQLSDGNALLTGALTRAQYGTLAGEQVGTYGITQGTLAASSNYNIAYTGANLSITKANLSIIAIGKNKTYGTNDPTLTYAQTGLVQNTIVDGVLLNDSLTGNLARAQYGLLAGEQVGTYGITQGTLAASGNYNVSFTGANLTIGQTNLAITANALSKIYGNDDPTLTYMQTGLVQGVTVDGVTLNDSLTGNLARAQYGTLAGEQVGTYGITQGTLAASGNYNVSFTGANLTVTPATLTVAANAQTKIYGNDDPTLTYMASGFANKVVDGVQLSDTNAIFTGALTRDQLGTVPGEQVGTYGITQGTLAASSNYTINYTGANLSVTPAALTVAANAQSKTYGTNDPTLTYSAGGFVNKVVDGVQLSDNVSVLTGALTRDQLGTLGGEQVGTYGITQGTLAASNYSINFTGSSLTINKANLTVTADSGQSKTYGTNDPTLTYTQTGLVQGATVDGVTLNDALIGALSRNGYGTLPGEQAGSYEITQGTLAATSNYSLTVTPGITFAITPATLTVTADAQTKVYGTNDPTLTYSASGFINRMVDGVQLTDTSAILAGALTRDQYGTLAGEQVGSYGITQGTLAASNNYNIAYTGANLTVTPATLTITAKAGQSKTYGDADPILGNTSPAGLVHTVVDGVALDDRNALSGVLGRNAGENVGSYAYTLGSLSAGANYTLALASSQPLFGITPATLTYVANPVSIAFGDPVPALSGMVTGFKFSDTLASATSGSLNFSTLATSTSQVGVYGILGSGLTANHGNYIFVQAASNDTAFTVKAASDTHPPGQVLPPPPQQPPSQTNVSFQAPTSQPVSISFTTPVRTANRNTGTQVANTNPADTTPTSALDLSFVPISQFDPAQYAGSILPNYKYQAGESAVFTMIARALKAGGKQPINDFWNTGAHNPNWPGNGHDKSVVKVSFSDGAGKMVAPTDANAFPIAPGTIDIPALLAHGPVLIGSGSAPTISWLLAFHLTADGKGILANDPQTGKTLVLAYDAQKKTVGGVVGIFDLKQGGATIPLAPTPAVLGDYAPGGTYPALEAFKASEYLAVSFN